MILYAPNVHLGGGYTLLKSLLTNFPKDKSLSAILDARSKQEISALGLKNLNVLYWVEPKILSRINAEIILYLNSKNNNQIFCFHNIPPILSNSKKIIIYFQNKLIIEKSLLGLTNFNTYIAISIQKILIKVFFKNYMIYLTQSYSIKEMVGDFLREIGKDNFNVFTMPFFENNHVTYYEDSHIKNWDFLYVSSGESHKNHLNLLRAWRLLDLEGISPSLALTIAPNYHRLIKLLKTEFNDLNVINLGFIDHDEVLKNYRHSNALIFASKSESFGLPLLEASKINLPIIAPELDYVRDICQPIETFDPNSPTSIARSVKRFLGKIDPQKNPLSPERFWEELFSLWDNS